MKINRIKIYRISLPFLMNFSHSLKTGASSIKAHNIVVEITANGGKIKGYGEGAPRDYVTGENQKEAVAAINDLIEKKAFPWEPAEDKEIWKFVDSLDDHKKGNAVICALEMALLDALGKEQNRHILDFFSHDFFSPKIHYGCAFPITGQEKLAELCRLFKKLKIKKLKLKMGKALEKNQTALKIISQLVEEDYDLKIDVNGAWDESLALSHIPDLNRYRVKVVEQPMMPDDPALQGFFEALKEYNIILMADESACAYAEVEELHKEGYYKMINVRLSKMGGFRRSFKIVDFLRKEKLSFQIGCHLGESGILSAAGRALSLLCNDAVYYDGSYDRLLLRKNTTQEDVSFGEYGAAGPLGGPGLGIKINQRNLDELRVAPDVIIEK
jgi:L-Ala-D/L-Glu epimerase